MPELTVENVGAFAVPQGKRLVLPWKTKRAWISCMPAGGMPGAYLPG